MVVVGAVVPGSFVARADLIGWPGVGLLARLMRIIPIDRHSLRRLPDVVDAVAARLRAVGWRTVAALSATDDAAALGCTHRLDGKEAVRI